LLHQHHRLLTTIGDRTLHNVLEEAELSIVITPNNLSIRFASFVLP
jgi:hypothetical protein